MKLFKVIYIITLLSAALMLYQNCGQGFQTEGSNHPSVIGPFPDDPNVSEKSCETILQEAYRDTFYNFTQENRCFHCHVPGGAGKSAFAQENYVAGMDAFIGVGVDKFSIKALSDHQSGYTGTHLKPSLDTNKDIWMAAIDGYNACGTDQIDNNVKKFVTSAKLIDLFDASGNLKVPEDEFQVRTWNLEDEEFAANAIGATFSISVMSTTKFKGIPIYVFTFPTLKTTNQTITVLGISVLINGQKLGRTTFDFKTVTLPPHSNIRLSNIGLDLQPEDGEDYLKSTDTVQIEFDYFIVN